VALWDVMQNCRLRDFAGVSRCRALAISHSGVYLAVATENHSPSSPSLVLLDCTTGHHVGLLEGSSIGEVLSLAFSSEDILAVGTRKAVRLLTVPGLQEIAELNHDSSVHSVCFSPDGRFLATGCGHGEEAKEDSAATVIWQVPGQGDPCRPLGSIQFGTSDVRATRFSCDGSRLAVGGDNKRIVVLSVANDFEQECELLCPAAVRCLAWHCQGDIMASGGEDMQVTVWDLSKKCIHFQLEASQAWINQVAFSPDGCQLAYAHAGGRSVCLCQLQLPGDAASAAAGDQQQSLPSLADMGFLPEQRSRGLRTGAEDPVCLEHSEEVLHCALSPDGRTLLAGGEDKRLVLWDVQIRQKRLDLDFRDAVTVLALGPHGRYAAAAFEAKLQVWDVANGNQVDTDGEEVDGEISALAFSHGAALLLAAGTKSEKVHLFSMPQFQAVQQLDFGSHVRSLHFSVADFLAAGGGTDAYHGLMTNKGDTDTMRAKVWETAQQGRSCRDAGTVLFTDVVHSMVFSASGKLLAVGGEDRKISVLIAQRLSVRAVLACPAGVRALAWGRNAGSHFLASAGEDCQVSVWDVLAEQVVLQLPKTEDWVCSLSFSADCSSLAYCAYSCSHVTVQQLDLYTRAEEEEEKRESKRSIAVPKQELKHKGTMHSMEGDLLSSEEGPRRLSLEYGDIQSPVKIIKSVGTVKGLELGQGGDNSCLARISLTYSTSEEESRGVLVSSSMQLGGREDAYDQTQPAAALAASHLGMADDSGMLLRAASSRSSVKLRHADEVAAVALNSSASMLAAGGEDCLLTLWDGIGGTKKGEFRLERPLVSVAVAPSGKYVFSADLDHNIAAYNASLEQLSHEELEEEITAMEACSSSTELLAVGTHSGQVMLLAAGDLQEQLAVLKHGGEIHSLCFSPDGGLLAAAGGTDEKHGLMTRKVGEDAQNMKAVTWAIPKSGLLGEEHYKEFMVHSSQDVVRAVAFSNSGGLLAVGDEDKKISVIAMATRKEEQQLLCPAGVRCLAWAKGDKLLASGGEDMQVSVWDVLNKVLVFQLPKAKDWLMRIAFTQDCNWLVACSLGSSDVDLWPVEVYWRRELVEF